MAIKRDKASKRLGLGQSKFVNSRLERFNMENCRSSRVLVLQGMKLSMEDYPKSPTKAKDMTNVSYASVLHSLMYVIITRPNIAQTKGFLCFWLIMDIFIGM